MTMRRLTLPAVALSLMLAAPASAAEKATKIDQFELKMDQFELWNGCLPVSLVVERLPERARKIGLRKEDIATAVRSRLRGARIYDESANPYLYVNVNVGGGAFSIAVHFERRTQVVLPHLVRSNPLSGYASTWRRGELGVSGKPGFILSSVAQHTDKFIDEYLRVNADACEKRPSAR